MADPLMTEKAHVLQNNVTFIVMLSLSYGICAYESLDGQHYGEGIQINSLAP